MAESIFIHFQSATWAKLTPVLNATAYWFEDAEAWLYPGLDYYCVRLYEYDNVLNEMEDDDIDRLVQELGYLPSISLCLELKRSLQNEAAEAAAILCVQFLSQFSGIADDANSEFWTQGEITQGFCKASGGFLDCYRHPRGAA